MPSTQELHEGPVHTVKYSPFHQDLLASGADDCSFALVQALSSRTDTLLHTNQQKKHYHVRVQSYAHEDYVRGLHWYKGYQQEALLVSGSWDQTLRTWSLDTNAFKNS
jgi:WD40 repeat protein